MASPKQNQDLKSPRNPLSFIAPGQVEHMERIQAGKQYLVSRRLFSDLEREKARKVKKQKVHSRRVKAIKRKKEARRKRIEQEANLIDSCSTISTSLSEEKQLATEWAELMMVEEEKRELQKAKEMERYVIALRAQLQELVATRKVGIPPLCSCGKTVWDTHPKTCANNCIFYRNPKGKNSSRGSGSTGICPIQVFKLVIVEYPCMCAIQSCLCGCMVACVC